MLNLQKKLYVATFQTNAHEVANQYGLGLEFNNTCISEDLDAGNRRKLISVMNQDLNENGFESAILHGPFTELYPAGIDRRARLMAKERLNEAFDVCRALSVSKMVVHTGWLPFIYFKEWQAEKSAAFWQDFMQDKPEAFTIYIENVLEDEPYMLADMMRRISNPQIKLCLDVGHANAMTQKNISVEKWIQELSPYIGHFHLHNNYGDGDTHGSFGDGSMDMNAILHAIEKHCADDVTFTIEAKDCAACAEWLKAHSYI